MTHSFRMLLPLALLAILYLLPNSATLAKIQNPAAKEDFYESFLLQIELNDVDGDGTPDLWKRYYATGSIKELNVDLDGDGQPDTVDRYSSSGAHTGSEYLKKFSFWQTVDDTWQTAFKHGMHQPNVSLQGFKKSPLGLYIQDSCYKQIGKERLKTYLFETLVDASHFLWKRPPVGRDHLRRLIAILHDSKRPLRIICDPQNETESESMVGFATPIHHPNYPAIYISPRISKEVGEIKIKTLIFHELFHLIGYLHYFDREYAYSCPACLFPSEPKLEPLFQKFACQVCSQNDLPTDPVYYKTLSKLLDHLQYRSLASAYLIITLSLNPFEEETFLDLIQLYTTRLFNPLFASTLIREALYQNLINAKHRTLLAQVDHLAKQYAYPTTLVTAAEGISKVKVFLFKGDVFHGLERLNTIQVPANPGFPQTDYRSFAYADARSEYEFLGKILPHLIRGRQKTFQVISKQRELFPFEQFTIEQDPAVRSELLIKILPKLSVDKLFEHLRGTLANSPDDEGKGVVLYYMGLLELKRGKLDAALAKFKESEISKSSLQDAWAASALIAFKKSETLKAKEILKRVIENYPNFGYAHYLMGRLYGIEKRASLEKEAFEKACAKGFKKACQKK